MLAPGSRIPAPGGAAGEGACARLRISCVIVYALPLGLLLLGGFPPSPAPDSAACGSSALKRPTICSPCAMTPPYLESNPGMNRIFGIKSDRSRPGIIESTLLSFHVILRSFAVFCYSGRHRPYISSAYGSICWPMRGQTHKVK